MLTRPLTGRNAASPALILSAADALDQGRTHRRHDVQQVEAPQQPALDLDLAARRLQHGLDAFQRESVFQRPDVGLLGKTEGDIAAVQFADDARPHGVVAVDDRPVVAAEFFEQGELGLEIVFHGAVEIEVVAGKRGEHRLGEGDIVDAVQAERGRGDLHDQVDAAGLDRLGHEGEQLGRLRGGQFRRLGQPGEIHAQGADGGGLGPAAASRAWISATVVVLPLVPVTPITCRLLEGSSKKRLAMALSARRSFLTCTQVTCGSPGGGGWIETTRRRRWRRLRRHRRCRP